MAKCKSTNKGGKFIFGKSLIREDYSIKFPTQAVSEYDIVSEGRVYLFTGSKTTGGFCVTRKGLLNPSKIGHILKDNPDLCNYTALEGAFTAYKGRCYCWLKITEEGIICLTEEMMNFLELKPKMKLLSIRSSNIAFTMGAKGPLLEKEKWYEGKIDIY